MELIKYDERNEAMFMALLPLYQAYEAEIAEEDLEEIFPEDEFDENVEYFQQYFEGKTTYICVIGGEYRGFVAFHVDTKKMPSYAGGYRGWGHLAEIYTDEQSRGLGMGRMLVDKAEEELKKLGVTAINLMNVLPANSGFWKAVGYTDTGKIVPEEGGRIFEKLLS